ncbi:dTDP-4-dehydrorhamnose reductase [Vibrio sp. SS-MA-C1-2]|uniref:dTDP-4-dehydrorhamnose reductase n=1 Tax=Vibrio sp. SS-MA-C1-2 TaxID=2908646 RepID=UPI001F2C676B|nr:dTDP-4-dehydrorhamnose reductase [Vibrio sp. SS-MA-C1-2]UJF18553.1 dTDP-4-dehydrorhamnose reductase [Vibrio sp. SS-MA-C1-2]
MKILITGANGQVGSLLTKKLSAENIEILAVNRDELDITDKDVVNTVVKDFSPDFIINAAAHTAVDKAEDEIELSYAINRDGPRYLALAAKSINATILHISTDYVFSGDKEGEYSEEDNVNPQCIYGVSKLAGEEAVQLANPKHIILRTAWVFGEIGNNFVKTMLRVGSQRDEMGIVADQFGGPTYAGDIADTLITIMHQLNDKSNRSKYGIYHYAGLPHVSWYQFADEIFNKAEESGLLIKPALNQLSTKDYPTKAKRPANSKLSCNKINTEFQVEASDWKLGLNRIEEYMM